MTHKQIETMRELRLWIGQIVVPAAMGMITLLTIPEVRSAVAAKAENMKNSIKNKEKKIINVKFKKRV